ncbi:MAG: biotin/lipoyl-containing protein, partial [Flavobacteriaceae bacterium]
MAKFELKLPKMGESVAEATITSWLKEVGDTIEIDDAVVEIATDKVDSDVPSEVAGILLQKNFEVDQVVKVGEVLAVIQTEGENTIPDPQPTAVAKAVQETAVAGEEAPSPAVKAATLVAEEMTQVKEQLQPIASNEKRFYSPLVKNIAAQENIPQDELDRVLGTGQNGRVTKKDILA